MILSDLPILALEIDYQLSMFACISEKSKTKITCIINYCCSGVFPTNLTLAHDVRSSNGDWDKMEVRTLLHAPFSTMWVTSSSRLGRIMSYILYLLPNRGIWRIKHDGTCKKKTTMSYSCPRRLIHVRITMAKLGNEMRKAKKWRSSAFI